MRKVKTSWQIPQERIDVLVKIKAELLELTGLDVSIQELASVAIGYYEKTWKKNKPSKSAYYIPL